MLAEIYFEQNKIDIQFNETDTMRDIKQKFLEKMNNQSIKVYFLYSGKIIKDDEILSQTLNLCDRERKRISLIAIEIEEKKLSDLNNVLCPICASECTVNFEDCKFCLKCEKGHIINNIFIKEFKRSQEIDSSKISCDFCHVNNIGNCDQFYYCVDSKKNMCPFCKDEYLKNECEGKGKRNGKKKGKWKKKYSLL